ncbi:hypothetical protein V8D89_008548 [Ganoderma adspersum]
MNKTVLNADVLLLVFSLAHKQTKLALMSTCQVLYREGGKQFLKSVNVRLRRQSQLKSFLRFMDADGGSRMRSLHRLFLGTNCSLSSRSVAKRFKQMLKRLSPVSRLTDLTILSLEPLLSAHPPLARAIAGLTSLKEIDFHDAGKLSLKMLKSMKSKLETAEIYFKISKGDASEDFVIMSLAQYSSSLRSLTVGGDTGYTEDPQDDDPQYPHLLHLTLDEPESHITWDYVRAFPNLKTLTIRTTNHGLYKADEEFRAENVAQLRRQGFSGAVIMLWVLGLSCPVSELSLEGDCIITPEIFRACLVPTRATRLRITIFQFSLFLNEEFVRVFEEGCAATLKVLELNLDICPDEYMLEGYDLDLGEVLDAVTDMLRSFSTLESVSLELHFEGQNVRREESPCPGEVFAEDLDVDAMCTALHEAVPSASYVQFALWNHPTRGIVTAEIGSEAKQ